MHPAVYVTPPPPRIFDAQLRCEICNFVTFVSFAQAREFCLVGSWPAHCLETMALCDVPRGRA